MHAFGKSFVLGPAVSFAAALLAVPAFGQELPDAPDANATIVADAAPLPASYADALSRWTSAEDIATFAGRTFVYDRARAVSLGERAGPSVRPAIHTPEAMFERPHGVCVDLARFGVETLNRIDPHANARYLMLEFEPVVVDGATLRRHWIGVFERDGAWWFFADSRRPGHVAGPYATIDAFVAEYARYRARSIVAWRERASLAREARRTALRRDG